MSQLFLNRIEKYNRIISLVNANSDTYSASSSTRTLGTPRGVKKCFDNNVFIELGFLVSEIGRGDATESEIKGACFPVNSSRTGCASLHDLAVLKLTSIKLFETEIRVLEICTNSVLAHETQNFPLTYTYTRCSDCSINATVNLRQRCGAILYEYMDCGSMFSWIKKMGSKLTVRHARSLFFQIFSALCILSHKYCHSHGDLHMNNVLVCSSVQHRTSQKSLSKSLWVYNIFGREYMCENLGYVFILWDFAHSEYLADAQTRHEKNSADFSRILTNFQVYMSSRGIHIFDGLVSKIRSCGNVEEILQFLSFQLEDDVEYVIEDTFVVN